MNNKINRFLTNRGYWPTLFIQFTQPFYLPYIDFISYKDMCNGHGRLETREYYTEKDISWMADARKGWKGLNGIGACRSTVEENGSVTSNVSYAIFSGPEMTAEKYGKRKRSHWQIENSLHWCLDIAFNEDQSKQYTEHINHAFTVNELLFCGYKKT